MELWFIWVKIKKKKNKGIKWEKHTTWITRGKKFISYLPNKVEIIISGDMPIIKGTRKTNNIDHKRKVQLSFQKKKR